MSFKRASEIFGPVDPQLKVIDGGTRRHKKKELSDWEKLDGAKCPKCGKDALRFRPQDGVCMVCAGEANEKELRDERKRARFLRYMRAHNARIGKRSHSDSSSSMEESV